MYISKGLTVLILDNWILDGPNSNLKKIIRINCSNHLFEYKYMIQDTRSLSFWVNVKLAILKSTKQNDDTLISLSSCLSGMLSHRCVLPIIRQSAKIMKNHVAHAHHHHHRHSLLNLTNVLHFHITAMFFATVFQYSGSYLRMPHVSVWSIGK